MATLTIEIQQQPLGATREGDSTMAAAYVARVTRIAEGGSSPPRGSDHREFVVGLGRKTATEVEAGLWSVELALPSGELLNEQVRIADEDEIPVSFRLGDAPHERLAWQVAEGSLPERDVYEARRVPIATAGVPSRAGSRAVPARTTERMRKALPSPIIVTESYARGSVYDAIRTRTQVTVFRRVSKPDLEGASAAERFERSMETWRELVAGLRLETPIPELAGLEIDEGAAFDPRPADDRHDVWRLGEVSDGERRFAVVVTNRSVELVSLPLPWVPRGGLVDGALLELVIDKDEVAERSRSSLTLRDPDFFGVLSYLKSGSLALAGKVAGIGGEGGNMLVGVLAAKRRNPLAAAAAAYALLGSVDLAVPHPWHPWLENLSRWYPWLPDGAVLHGRWLMFSGSDIDGRARAAFLRAFRRGLPFYSLGLAWLLEGLRQFDDDECAEAARVVRQVSLRYDVGQVFTVLRLHAPPDPTET
ncbi:hypothetical protein [Sphingomonas sp. BK580]|uniref:hypothetical protein n=1 Tax=Sphingomonas sp. BK580 TaxID=2586972 RepID=UPI00160B898E|nr:hypothetical protein [Sphingomonas sp. BK580]MBB3695228.1 hypothetical protein [Sphingomonas sp. BK580]